MSRFGRLFMRKDERGVSSLKSTWHSYQVP
uniref:Uncharacterized protein n=1 Tax=Setaria viridis TaxID=4556 RepID=A0A4U6UZG2_SETVI|nr:hypothetical protein SEVIR_5G317550v2 [Setaria viridis]